MGYWLWFASYAAIAGAIIAYNDDFKMEALTGFSDKFRILVEEMSMYFRPIGFPIDLVARLCMGTLQESSIW